MMKDINKIEKDFLIIEKLDDFMLYDEKQTKLINYKLGDKLTLEKYNHLENIRPQLEFIVRLYTMDSKKYNKQ